MTHTERRKYPRYHLRIPIKLSCSISGEDAIDATSLNICLHGLYCTVTRYVPLFGKLLVTLIAPERASFPAHVISQIEGVVVRIEPETEQIGCKAYDVALYFEELSEQQEEALQRLIASHLAAENDESCPPF